MVENQAIPGHVPGDGTVRFRFCPKAAKTYPFTIRSNVLRSMERPAGSSPSLLQPRSPRIRHRAFRTGGPMILLLQFAEGEHHGAKSVSRWREDFLGDFAKRMLRCKSPVCD